MDVKELKLNLSDFLKKYVNNNSLYIIIIIGIVFMLSVPSGKQKSKKDTHTYDAYSDEERLSQILSKVDGAGDVSVMITYYGTTSCDVAFQKKQNSTTTESQKTQSEECSVITDSGIPLVKGEVYPKAKGVVIISEGAKNAEVKKALTDAASAALEIASYKVCVLEGKERN